LHTGDIAKERFPRGLLNELFGREVLCYGKLSKKRFVLRQAQHERKIFDDFDTCPVRPELVEG